MGITIPEDQLNFPDADWNIVGDIGQPAYQGAWVGYGGAFRDFEFRRDSDGWVHLRGLAKSGTMGTHIFTLPEGYRPLRDYYSVAMANANVSAYVRVQTNGIVSVSSSTGTNAYVSISNCRFPSWQRYDRYNERYSNIVNPNWQNRVNDIDWGTGVMLHANGMGALLGIHGVTTGVSSSGVLLPGRQPNYSYLGHMVDSTATINRFDISSRYGIFTNTTTSTWSIAPSMMFPSNPGLENAYIAPTLLNSWANFGFDINNRHAPAGYYKDPDGFVYLRGLLKDGSSVSANMFVLPAGYRPSGTLVFGSISNGGTCRIDVQADGTVNAAAGGNATWTSINGLCFYADQ